MEYRTFFLLFLLCSGIIIGQERLTLKTKYKISSERVFLSDETESKRYQFLLKKRYHLRKKLKKVNKKLYESEKPLPNKDFEKFQDSLQDLKDTLSSYEKLLEDLTRGNRIHIKVSQDRGKTISHILNDNVIRDGFVKMEEDKVYLNFYLNQGDQAVNRDHTYYFQLKNRQTIYFKHYDTSISALIIPIKYRFGGINAGNPNEMTNRINEDFTSNFNANLFLSKAFWGKTKFTYLKNVDNSIRDVSCRGGVFVGLGTQTLNASNTSAIGIDRQFSEESEETKRALLLWSRSFFFMEKF